MNEILPSGGVKAARKSRTKRVMWKKRKNKFFL